MKIDTKVKWRIRQRHLRALRFRVFGWFKWLGRATVRGCESYERDSPWIPFGLGMEYLAIGLFTAFMPGKEFRWGWIVGFASLSLVFLWLTWKSYRHKQREKAKYVLDRMTDD